MAKARTFRIEKAHIENAASQDPDLTGILPKVGYVVFPFRDKNARPVPYEVDGFKITMMSDLVGGSAAPVISKKSLAFLLIGTDFSKDPSAIPYQNYLRKKGYAMQRILVALAATHIHHEAIHVRLQMDFSFGDFKKLKEISKEYLFTFVHMNRTDEGRALYSAIYAMAKNAALPDKTADTFAATEFEKFTQEKFSFARVNRMTPGYNVENALIEESYFRRFESTLDEAGGASYLKIKSNAIFRKTYAELRNKARAALTAYFNKYDTELKP